MSTLMCPVYGDFYSFPWKRGPHDNILDYVEAVPIYDMVRESIFRAAIADPELEFLQRCITLYNKEDESKHVEVKASILRLLAQVLRSFDGSNQEQGSKEVLALDLFLTNPSIKTLLMSAAFSSKDPVLQALAVQIFAIMLKQVVEDQSLDQQVLVLDIQKVYLLFEKNCKTEPLISIVCCSLMGQMLSQDQQ